MHCREHSGGHLIQPDWGLCTMCFHERVDRIIGRNHLYKESIILVKAWCYYESGTLGSHVLLPSTYALDVLVL
ncbi:hypothetical protein CTI12_AA282530 [Artemisia annua]|uniref:PAP/OAS1 substrate-binding-related domain-containing protein n=1 Tax=Artemisia annua TaxID=35608 RepID=A0A2U1NDA6_ARTAN|nr:hypothetical protein CTI12_AA282530 [Artemisia annua]